MIISSKHLKNNNNITKNVEYIKNMTQFIVKIQNQLHIFVNIFKIFNCYEIEKGKYWL